MRLLFIRFGSLGDVILTTGILKSLHEKLPGVRIDVLTFSVFADVYSGLDFIHKIYTVDKGIPLGGYLKELKTLPDHYDYIFDLHGNTRSLIARCVLRGKSYKYKKAGLRRRLFVKWRLCANSLKKHVVQRYAEAVFPALGLPIPTHEELRPYYRHSPIRSDKKLILHPFASKFTKTWPYFQELAEELVRAGWDVKIIGKGDFPHISGVEQVQTSTIKEMFEYMSDASLVVSTDSGPLHAAIALGLPTVAIFGSTTKELGFYPDFGNCEVVELNDVMCRPCHVHGRSSCPKGHFDCMKKITIRNVLDAIRRLT